MAKKKASDGPRFLWKFHADCGRMGDLDALFTATDAEVASIIGKEVVFGEVLGKHSEIVVEMEREHFQKVEDVDAAFVAKFDELGLGNGHNPFHYLDE